ncbi:MAG: rhamnulokinase family protein [Anaerolineae bacterium]
MAEKTVLAVDLGAESGRVMAVHFDGKSLRLEDLNRFPNPITTVNGTLYWDFLHLWRCIQEGIEAGKPYRPVSVGVDTWGVDFGLLDAQGNLISSPVNYRDPRTDHMMARVFGIVPRPEVFAHTGIQFMQINTLYQLMSLVASDSPQLKIAETFLTSPDLLNYWLTGEKVSEFSIATTTQLYNPTTGDWAREMMAQLGIPTHIFPPIVPPGTRLGKFGDLEVIAPACHDTGDAVAAVPTSTPDYAYISSGTWSLVGLEVDKPILTPEALNANVTNEGGVYGTYRFLKNVMGLWIVQQCRATWAAEGTDYTYAELVTLAEQAPPLRSVFDVNDPRFLGPGDHPQRIREWCAEHNLPQPETHGAVIRSVLESLALKYRDAIRNLLAIAGRRAEVVHIVGGGTQNELLNQFTADATGLPVVAGPVEATVMGNALIQLITLGEIGSLHEARQIVASLGGMKRYEPHNVTAWDDAAQRLPSSTH